MPHKDRLTRLAYEKEWLARKWRELVQAFGGQCAHCSATEGLEFAHLAATPLTRFNGGKGRGKKKRYFDIRHNPSRYLLLCDACHVKQERYLREEREAREKEVQDG